MAHSLSDRKNPILVVDHVSYSYHTLHGETRVLEDISFNACGETEVEVVIDKAYVDEHLESALKSMNLKKYII